MRMFQFCHLTRFPSTVKLGPWGQGRGSGEWGGEGVTSRNFCGEVSEAAGAGRGEGRGEVRSESSKKQQLMMKAAQCKGKAQLCDWQAREQGLGQAALTQQPKSRER